MTLNYANSNFSILASSRNYQFLKFYFEFISRKNHLLNKLLALFAPFDIFNALFDYCWPNTIITINKNTSVQEKVSLDIEKELLDRWPQYFDKPRPKQLHSLAIVKGARKLSFVFRDNSAMPVACIKQISNKNHSEGLLNEFAKLKVIHSESDGKLSLTTPRPFFKVAQGEELAFAMSYLKGKPVDPGQFRADKLQRDAKMVRNIYQWWKLQQQNATSLMKFENGFFLERLERAESLFLNSFPHDVGMRDELAALKSSLMTTENPDTWFGPVHGDFWKGNLLFDEHTVQVIDWERYENNGLPIYDLFLFLTTFYEHGDYIRLFAETYLEETDYNALVKKILSEARDYLCLDEKLAGIMFEVFLIEMCVQGPVYFREKTSFDVQWKERLDFFLANKETILQNNFRLTA